VDVARPFIELGPLHPHLVFEILAYALGFGAYRLARRRGDSISAPTRWSLVVAAAVGAALGSKLLALLNTSSELLVNFSHPMEFMASGKTMVGGLLGGWIAVEITKRRAGIDQRTGDLFAIPICVGVAIGRVGCFLTGLPDRTYGVATSLPWGVDFGDGVLRHPTQLYEILFVTLLALSLGLRRPRTQGMAFRTLLLAYLGFRLLIDSIKPGERMLHLTAIQWACVLGLAVHLRFLAPRRTS
jgi:prolipoprotein diacylglyceryltransferase